MKSLRDWLDDAEKIGQLRTILDADWNKEIGGITEVATDCDQRALLFDEISDYPKGYRILTNYMLNVATLALTIGLPTNLHITDLVSAIEERIPIWDGRIGENDPKEVNDGSVMENVQTDDEVDLLKFPTPVWNEHDGGRYIGTGCAVALKDPDTGLINVGTYRIMIHDKNTAGILLVPQHYGRIIFDKYRSKNQPCPFVASLGHHPIMLLISTYLKGKFLDVTEYNYVGAILGEPIDVIRGKLTGLPFPANSEIVIEGEISPTETQIEGPFGEYMGYYAGGKEQRPVLKIRSIYHRNDPIILGAPAFRPPGGNNFWGCAIKSAEIQSELRNSGVPDAKVWVEPSGVKGLTVVSIKQRYAGHASQAGHIALMCGASGKPSRYAIVVDDDIDPSNLNDVIWALCTRTDPVKSIDIVQKTLSTPLDPIIKKPTKSYYTSGAVIDACRPFEWIKDFAAVVGVSKEYRKEISEKWFKSSIAS